MNKVKKDKIGVAIVGLGYWGPNLVRNFSSHPLVHLQAICDEDKNKLDRVHYPVDHRFSSFENLLDIPHLDAIVIATPVKTHYSLVLQALKKEKHVWVEKPITDKSSQALELVALAKQQQKILFVDHTFVYQPAIQKAKEIIASGELGDILYYDSTRINLGLLQQDINVVWDLAPHDLSILNYLIGKYPHSVTAIGASHNQHHLEDIAYVTFLYHEGLLAHLNLNWLSPVKVRRILIGGSKKMMVYDDMEPTEKIKIYDKGITVYGGHLNEEGRHQMLINYRLGDMRAPHLGNRESLAMAVDHFVKRIQGKEDGVSEGEEGLKVVQMIEAILGSLHHSGESVKISFRGT